MTNQPSLDLQASVGHEAPDDRIRRLEAELAATRAEHQQAMALQEIQHLVLERIARGEPLPLILETLVHLAEVETGMLGSVLLCQDGKLRHGAAPSLPQPYNAAIDGIAIGQGVGSCGTAAATGQVVIVEDVGTHPYWAPFKDLALGFGLQACWSHPVVDATGNVLGTFALYYSSPRAPEPFHLRLVELASHLAGIAIERDRAQAQLQANFEELEQQRSFIGKLVQDLPGGVAYLDTNLVYQLVNGTYAKVFERRPEDFLGRHLLDVFPEAEAQGSVQRFRHVLETGERFEALGSAFAYTDEAGTHHTYWDYTLTAQRDRHGQIIGIVALCLDVSARVAAERARQEAAEELVAQTEELQMQSEELNAANEEINAVNEALIEQTMELQAQQATLQGVLDSSMNGILLGEAVRDGAGAIRDFRFTLVNPRAEEIVGFKAEDLLGHCLLERFPGNLEAGLFDKYVGVATTGVPAEAESYYSDGRLDFWVAMSAVKVGDGVAITFSDITERKRVEGTLRQQADQLTGLTQALEAQRRFAETLIERLPAGVAYIDKDFHFRVVNPTMARFYGKPLAEVVDRYVYDVLPGSEEAIAPIYDHVRKTGELLAVNEVAVPYLLDGQLRMSHWDATVVPYLDARGAFDGWLVLAAEVSDRLQLQAERDGLVRQRIEDLERANVHKEQFLSILSHELRTPINAIMGFASVLDDGVLGPLTDQQHDYMGKILDGSDRLLALITDLLDMSRIQAGKFAITPGEVNLPLLCRNALDALQPLADQQGVALAFVGPPALPPVTADRQRIEQIVTNLLSNAIKFTPEGGQVSLDLLPEADQVRVQVRDTGIGIAATDQERIFDAFTQVDMSNTRRSGGAGLGLAIAKSLVEAHHGQIGVESQEGHGSVFWFTVPGRWPDPAPGEIQANARA